MLKSYEHQLIMYAHVSIFFDSHCIILLHICVFVIIPREKNLILTKTLLFVVLTIITVIVFFRGRRAIKAG